MTKIILHPEFGINPSMVNCFFCGESKEIVLVGNKVSKFKKEGLADSEGKMNSNIGVIDTDPCTKCTNLMKKGIIFISTKNGDKDYRTGGWCVVKEEAVKKFGIQEDILKHVLEQRVCFIEDDAYDKLGLPRCEINNLKGE